jgi:hypothetical protein
MAGSPSPLYGSDGKAWLMIDESGGTAVGFGNLTRDARPLGTPDTIGQSERNTWIERVKSAVTRYEEAQRMNERLDAEDLRMREQAGEMAEELERLRLNGMTVCGALSPDGGLRCNIGGGHSWHVTVNDLGQVVERWQAS